MRRLASLVALGLGAILFVTGSAASQGIRGGGSVPIVRFHYDNGELLQFIYPSRYGGAGSALAQDAAWTRDEAEDLERWWERQGSVFLDRVADLSGLDWPYRDIDVYLVRFWPTISIQHPLVLALDAVLNESGELEGPDDEDLRTLLLAHQVTHYLLDDPDFLPEDEIDPVYGHPFLEPGNYSVEAMVNWVTYSALEEIWGRERLSEATSTELWGLYNPNHGFVVDELRPRWQLTRRNTLREYLETNPPESEIFRVREAYLRQARTGAAEPEPERENLSGTAYGFDLGESFGGDVFVSYVDAGSPADVAGLRQGDVLATIEGRPLEDDRLADTKRRIDASWEENREVNLSVMRNGEEVFVTVRDR